ncbi:secretory calcium-binding phosphoprotein 1 isoform X2 [Antennarius striatus]|uniref:secretory calcium-binding phosphoprotein 1 isoform X2 n=1 Tax=Antennarius striatus TaxID=241820 RepID=UPI0035ADB8C8
MKVIIIAFCLVGAVFSIPLVYNDASVSNELGSNTAESVSASHSAENQATLIQVMQQSSEEKSSSQVETPSVPNSPENKNIEIQQSSEESASSQSQSLESESLESASVETNSTESDSQSAEDDEADSITEITDSSLSSEEEDQTTSEESNSQSDEADEIGFMGETRDDSMGSEENVRKNLVQVIASVIKTLSAENSSTEVTGQLDLTGSSVGDSSDTSETSDSQDTSESTEDSDASDSMEIEQIKTQDCVNGTKSCESDEYFFQDIGDDAQLSVPNLMVSEDTERELTLKR